jgi:soluble lytic murein transglycosylase-like protein
VWRFRLLEDLERALCDNWFVHFVCAIIAIAALVLGYLAPSLAAAPAVPDLASSYRREYARIVRSEWGIEAPIASLAAQIHQESGWNCRAVSRVGARGCAQFMPATARWIADVDRGLRDGDVYSPAWAFRAQAVYMRYLRDRVKGSAPCDRMAFAMSAYNGGLGYVYKRQRVSPQPGVCFGVTCDINPGIAPANQRENAGYPRRILLELEPRYVGAGWGLGACEERRTTWIR